MSDYILDAHGRPIEGATVTAYLQQDEDLILVASDTTSADGNFILNLSAGTYKLVVECDTFERKEVQLKI